MSDTLRLDVRSTVNLKQGDRYTHEGEEFVIEWVHTNLDDMSGTLTLRRVDRAPGESRS